MGIEIHTAEGTADDITEAIFNAAKAWVRANQSLWDEAIIQMDISDRDSFDKGVSLAASTVMANIANGTLRIEAGRRKRP